MQQKNYYDILGVSENASESDIKQAYRKLAKEYHPDRHPGDKEAEAKFKELGEAYEVLKDPAKRKKYDELRRYSSGGAQGSMSYEEFMNRFGGQATGGAEEFTWGFGGDSLDDIFSTLFGGGGRSSRRRRATHPGGGFHFSFGGTDPQSGGFSQGTRPRGARAQEAHAQAAAEPQATADPFFKRKGDDAYVDIPINLAQAMLGSTVRVRTPQGKKANVKIPAGTQPEAVLRLRGLGFSDRGRTGDLYIRTHLKLPEQLTDEEKNEFTALFDKLGMKY